MLISEITVCDSVATTGVIKDVSLKTARNGNKYVKMIISDKTGEISCQVWQNAEEIFEALKDMKVVKVGGNVESFKNSLIMQLNSIEPVPEEEVDHSLFVPVSKRDLKEMAVKIGEFIESIEDEDYKSLVSSFFSDSDFWNSFLKAPAAKKNHHAYVHGLVEHTLDMLIIADAFCKIDENIDRSLLISGVLFHDIGKIDEYCYETMIDSTDCGMLIGHIMMGFSWVKKRAEELKINTIKRDLICHLILSHHGRVEWGSPMVPKVKEAYVLHHVDCLCSFPKIFDEFVEKDTKSGNWTEFCSALGSYLYKGEK